jgi:hypothetical protein
MTYTDHTAPTCPSVRNEPQSRHFPYSDLQLYPLSFEQEKRLTRESRAAGTLLAVTVIHRLLDYNDACKRANVRIKRNAISPWPLTPAQVSGLHAALFYLDQYIGLLPPERGG